ncbi:sensor histidine kinase [Serinicoccus kebangsaanensis]|uniref:sensor histidine kinase n=1 Tax=Serinicoccus kebangsaanensis TaxID=2602069 RepID=UPI00178C4A80|nr:histidine kinase [Serinicoccus kebangsaanensis]
MLAIVLATIFDLGTTGVLIDDLALAGGGTAPAWLIALLVLVMSVVLALRYRFPVPSLVIVGVITIGLTLALEYGQPIFCLLVAIHAAARRGGLLRWWGSLVVGLVQVPLIVRNVAKSFTAPEFGDYLSSTTFFAALVLAAWGSGTVERYAQRRATALHGEIDVRAEQAAQAERHRIARELHDIVAHSVSAMMMQAAGARAMSQSVGRDLPEDARVDTIQRALGTIETTGAQSMRELHRLLGVLRDEEGEPRAGELDRDLSPSAQPGLDDIEALVEVPRSSGLIVEVHRSGTPQEVDPSVGGAAYRVVQESLTNALKHAGRGALVDVYLAWQGSELQVQVRSRASHGARPATPNGGTGLRGLRERVGLVGGNFDAGWSGEEFVSTAVLPVRPPSSGGPPSESRSTRNRAEPE